MKNTSLSTHLNYLSEEIDMGAVGDFDGEYLQVSYLSVVAKF